MKLVDLKLPKKTRKQLEKEMAAEAPEPMDEQYPWGVQLRFDKREIEKIEGLQNINAGTAVNIQAIGKVTEVRTTDAEKGRKRHNVEIQIQKIAIAPRTKEKPASLNETVTTIAQARRM